jgi:exodeoxyribonuclease V alpha subunit
MMFVPPMLATRNLLYTAVTRGKDLVVLVGSEERLRVMVENAGGGARCTALASFLQAANIVIPGADPGSIDDAFA